MKKFAKILSILSIAVAVSLPMAAQAQKQPQIKSEIVMKVGKKVNLFHSGTADVKKEVCVGDVIPVYRELPAGGSLKVKEVGKVKILAYVADHYIEGEVVEGELKVGDVAKKETAACLIQPAKKK